MKTKNILIFIATMQKGGAERVISLLLKEYEKNKNLTIHLIQLEDGVSYEISKNIKHTILSKTNKSNIRKLLELPFVAWQLSKYIKINNIDVVVSFLYRPNYINIITKLFTTKHKVIINVRSTTSRYLDEGLLGKINIWLIKKLFNKSDLIVSNSKGVDADLKSIVDISTDTKVIHNPLDIEYINSQKDICKDIRFEFKNGKKYIISVGRLIALKRNQDLIDAFYELQKTDKYLELIFLGDGELKNDLTTYCNKLNIKTIVHFLGNVSNPFYYLNRSDLFVLNSKTEGFPNVLVEAMACGLEVISSDCKSGPKEILDDEKHGYLYPVGNIEILVEKMKKVLYTNNKKNNLQRVKDFNIDKIMQEFTKIL